MGYDKRNEIMELNPIEDFFGFPFWFGGTPVQRPQKLFPYKTDIKKNGEVVSIEMELPGFKKDEVDVTVEGNRLMISAKKIKEKEVKDENTKYLRRERYVGNITRTFDLGEKVNPETLKAKLEDGLLTVSFIEPTVQRPQIRKLEL